MKKDRRGNVGFPPDLFGLLVQEVKDRTDRDSLEGPSKIQVVREWQRDAQAFRLAAKSGTPGLSSHGSINSSYTPLTKEEEETVSKFVTFIRNSEQAVRELLMDVLDSWWERRARSDPRAARRAGGK